MKNKMESQDTTFFQALDIKKIKKNKDSSTKNISILALHLIFWLFFTV